MLIPAQGQLLTVVKVQVLNVDDRGCFHANILPQKSNKLYFMHNLMHMPVK